MQTPSFANGQFVDGTLLNGAIAQLMNNFEVIGADLHTPGLLNPSSLVFTAPSGMNLGISAPSLEVLFGNGLVVSANQTTNGASSSSYALNLASLVPGSGSVTVYIVAGYFGQIGEQQVQVVGPPQGHPDFDATFAPFLWYTEELDTLSIAATTTPPDNLTTLFELARTSLSAGQSTINLSNVISGTHWTYASAVLNPTGITPGTYTGATVTVSGDGRITGISGVAYGPLAGTNTWTGANTFNQPVTVKDPNLGSSGGIVVSGSAAGATIMLKGTGSGSTPNKWLRALNGVFNILNNAYATILTLTDAGSLSVTGGITAGGGDVITAGSVQAAGNVNAGAAITTGTTILAGTFLRATFGATGTGDENVAPILADFGSNANSATDGWTTIPSFGLGATDTMIIQWGEVGVASGPGSQVSSLPRAFPNRFFGIVISFLASVPPEAPNVGVVGAEPATLATFKATNTAPVAGSNGCFYIAIGW